MTTKDLDLGQLAEYEIVGELSGRDDAKVLIATRRSDQRAVLITIVREPAGDEGNALSHLAADVNLLVAMPHQHVLPVLEGRWIGSDGFAVVSDRPASPSLDEMLARREEEFPYARIAAVLRDVNAALEWARGEKVVHRALRLDTIYVEPGSDDVQVSFVMTALPATGVPGADADARTLARLARAMLTRSAMDPERDRLPLSELRPGLPTRLVEQTDAMLAATESAIPDVSGYISAIAMAEEMKRAEVERETVRQEIDEEQRRIRAELAAEREAHDRDLAEQARKFAEEREHERKAAAKEREQAQREIVKLRAALDKERQQLAREREELGRKAEELAKKREELARKRQELSQARHELAAERAQFRGEIDSGRVEPAVLAGMTPLMDHALDAPDGPVEPDKPDEPYDELVDETEPAVVAFGDQAASERDPASVEPHDEALVQDEPVPVEPHDELVDDEEPVLVGAAAAAESVPPAPRLATSSWQDRVRGSSAFRTAAVAVLLLIVLIGAVAVALSRRSGGHEQVAASAPALRVVDSMGGSLAAPVSAPDTTQLAPATPPESVSTAVARSSARAAARRREAAAAAQAVRPQPAESSSTVARGDTVKPLPFTQPADTVRRDSLRRDSVRVKLDSVPKIVVPKLDSVRRRDSVPPAPR